MLLVGFLASLLLAAPHCHVTRDGDGRIARDRHQVTLFRATHACPRSGKLGGVCHGYVVDHICPLSCCGRDDPSNMQWQTKADAKAKDAWEWDCSSCSTKTGDSGPRHVEEASPPAVDHQLAGDHQRQARPPTAICRDGTNSYSAHRSGTCNHHGGVANWLREPSQ